MNATLQAGWELDAEVAERVMGWTHLDRSSGYYAVGIHPGGFREGVPRYSTDIAAAWQVVEMFQCTVVIQRAPSPDGRVVGYRVSVPDITHKGKPGEPYRLAANADADTAPLAICLAALKTIPG